jgi:hypothetical protein
MGASLYRLWGGRCVGRLVTAGLRFGIFKECLKVWVIKGLDFLPSRLIEGVVVYNSYVRSVSL